MSKTVEEIMEQITSTEEEKFVVYANERSDKLLYEIRRNYEELGRLTGKLEKVKSCDHKNWKQVGNFLYDIYECECGLTWGE